MEDPAWDRATVHNTVDLLQVLERGAERLASVPAAVGLKSLGGDMFTKSSVTLRTSIPIWRRALEHAGAIPRDDSVPGALAGPGSTAEPALGPDSFMPIDFSDDAWMTDMFTSWDNSQI